MGGRDFYHFTISSLSFFYYYFFQGQIQSILIVKFSNLHKRFPSCYGRHTLSFPIISLVYKKCIICCFSFDFLTKDDNVKVFRGGAWFHLGHFERGEKGKSSSR